jgi:hypothetical protein
MLKGLNPYQDLWNVQIARKGGANGRGNVGGKNNEKKIHVFLF